MKYTFIFLFYASSISGSKRGHSGSRRLKYWKEEDILYPKDSLFQSVIVNLSSMQHVHPPDGLRFADFAQVTLGGLQIRVPENNFRDDLQRDAASAGVGRRVAAKVMRGYVHLEPRTVIPDHGSGC